MSLHHGSYTLHVRMLNDDGTMGENEAVLKITITPPLLRNRWLMLVFLVLVGCSIYFWRRRFLKKYAERAELENYRNEIHKKHWMSAMRRKMGLHRKSAADTESDDVEEDAEEVGDDDELAPVIEGVKEKTDIVALLRDVCENFKAPGGKIIKISFFPLTEHMDVMADQTQVGFMIKTLLLNSARFAPANSTVKVFAEKQSDNAVIRVIDKGVGIPDDVMPHLFEKIENDQEGTNLHLVADIAKSHGGNVKGEMNIGGGTVFTITLPLIPEVIEEAVMMDDDE